MSNSTERPISSPSNIDPSETLPKKKGLLPQPPENPGNPTIFDTKENRSRARTHTELTIARMTYSAAIQPGLRHMSADRLAKSIVNVYKDETSDWIGKFEEQKTIENTITRIRKESDNFISYPKKLPSELLEKLSGELSEETVDELLSALAEIYS